MLASLLVVTLALPPTNELRRVEVDVEGDLSVGTLSLATQPFQTSTPGSSLGGTGAAGVTLFPRPLRDDDAPPSLQPFLQRVTQLHLGGNGSGEALTFPSLQSSPSAETMTTRRAFSSGYVDAEAFGYADWVFWQLSLAVDYQTRSDTANDGTTGLVTATTHELLLPVLASLGVRVRDLLFWAGWTVTPYRVGQDNAAGSFTVSNWSHASVGFDGAFGRRFYLTATVNANDAGAVGNVSFTAHLGRRIDLFAGVGGGYGSIYSDSENVYDTVAGSVGAAVWLTPHERISLGYAPSWTRSATPANGPVVTTGEDEVTHTINVELIERR